MVICATDDLNHQDTAAGRLEYMYDEVLDYNNLTWRQVVPSTIRCSLNLLTL